MPEDRRRCRITIKFKPLGDLEPILEQVVQKDASLDVPLLKQMSVHSLRHSLLWGLKQLKGEKGVGPAPKSEVARAAERSMKARSGQCSGVGCARLPVSPQD